jgi:hypothetical protein
MTNFDTLYKIQKGFLPPEFRTSDERVRKVADAITAPLNTLRQLEEFERTQRDDELTPPARQRARVAEVARRWHAQTSNEMLEAQAQAEAYINDARMKIEEASKPSDTAVETRRAAIRAELSTLESPERIQKVSRAIDAGECEIIAAVATYPKSETLAPFNLYQRCRDAFEEQMLGDDYFIVKDLEDGLQVLKSATVNADIEILGRFAVPAHEGEQKSEKATEAYYAALGQS